jgi:hypothetical protein
MSEYWKSTPKYWCKHCGIYVRDTKLERSNHEATGKHQGALKRFLRDLHRGHDREEREKDRAKREIERLNGVVASSSSSAAASSSSSAPRPSAPGASSSALRSAGAATEAQRQQQWEQLAELGIEVPTALRGDMAMAGEWTVTNSRVVVEDKVDTDGNPRVDALATGVRKRTKREGEEEEEEAEKAVQGLFKKTRRWGRDSRRAGDDDDAELDALLSGTLAPKKEKVEDDATDEPGKKEKEEDKEDGPPLKKEPVEDDDQGVPDSAKPLVGADETASLAVKVEAEAEGGAVDVPAVVFKKRKPKNVRQK